MISDTEWAAFDVDLTDNHMLANNRAWTNGNGVMFACTTSLMQVYNKWHEPIPEKPLPEWAQAAIAHREHFIATNYAYGNPYTVCVSENFWDVIDSIVDFCTSADFFLYGDEIAEFESTGDLDCWAGHIIIDTCNCDSPDDHDSED